MTWIAYTVGTVLADKMSVCIDNPLNLILIDEPGPIWP